MYKEKKIKKYKDEILQIKKAYQPSCKHKKKHINKHWKEDWKGFIEYTYPWDGSCILETIVYRLEILKTNLKYCSHTEIPQETIDEISSAVELGKKILDEEGYYKEAQDFADEHCSHYAYVYKKIHSTLKDISNDQGDLLKIIEMPKDNPFGFNKMVDKSGSDPLSDYLQKNNLTEYKDVIIAYGGEWDSDENHLKYKNLRQAGAKNKIKDAKKFFNLLASKLEGWKD